jgi:23S rRNA pseudouridine2605 synthase
VVTELGTKADPTRDKISIDGRPVRPEQTAIYLALNKPTGVVTTMSDPEGRPTVRDILGRMRQRVFPVGRLDFHSAGLLILTNDGELAQRLTHPRYGVRKTYRVKVKGRVVPEQTEQLSKGVALHDGVSAPAQVRIVEAAERKTWLEITLAEGKNRQVRRMCEGVGLSVEKLSRIAFGPLKLGKLAVGAVRPLTEGEVRKLRRVVGI